MKKDVVKYDQYEVRGRRVSDKVPVEKVNGVRRVGKNIAHSDLSHKMNVGV